MPQHLGFAADGTLKLLDFGAAAIVRNGAAIKRPPILASAALRYTSPEALTGAPCTAAADVFAFATLTWCMLSHAVPHAAVPDCQVATVVSAGVREPLSADWSFEVRQLLAEGWAAQPESRYATALMRAGAVSSLANHEVVQHATAAPADSQSAWIAAGLSSARSITDRTKHKGQLLLQKVMRPVLTAAAVKTNWWQRTGNMTTQGITLFSRVLAMQQSSSPCSRAT
eukprot:8164-Heterococcus_DN1.PRE.10